MTASNRAASRTLRVMGPFTLSVPHARARGYCGTQPGEARHATMPQKLAGVRSDPPRSLPTAAAHRAAATAAADPPLEPPGVRLGSCGLRHTPDSAFAVTGPTPSGGVLVLPITTAPSARSRATQSWSSAGMLAP